MGKVIRETYQAIYKHGVKHPSKPLSKLLIGYNDFVLLKMECSKLNDKNCVLKETNNGSTFNGLPIVVTENATIKVI